MSGLDLDNTLAGYHSDDFLLLKAVIPVTADTSQAVFDCRALKASPTADLVVFRSRVGRGTFKETIRRIAALRLRLNAANVLVDDDGRILLPTEAWPVAVDLAALRVFFFAPEALRH